MSGGNISAEEAYSSNVLEKIKGCLKEIAESVKISSRTSALWVQYISMIDIFQSIMHKKQGVTFAVHPSHASIHGSFWPQLLHQIRYTVFANLSTQRPNVYQCFRDGLHVIRRSNQLWAGLSSDLVIEQVLIRSLKTSGSLTRGQGITEKQLLLWLFSWPACAEVNQAMQEFTGVNYNTGEQNKDINTKDVTHQRKSKGKASKTVTVLANMTTIMKKEQFLANQKNEHRFIFMLSTELEKSNCKTYHAPADADLLIVQKAVQSATTSTTILVGDDTDLIVLLCYLESLESLSNFKTSSMFREQAQMFNSDSASTKLMI